MAKDRTNLVSAFDCDIIREAFRAWVTKDDIPEDQWRYHAGLLLRTWTGKEITDPDILDWIVRK